MKNIIFTLLLISCVTISYAETSCKVNDPNIADSYVGECLDGFAHGQGVAKGRDEYRGSFFKGDIHGYGVYTWGDNTEWKSQRYDGWYLKGKRSGYGILSMNIDSEIYRKKTGSNKNDKSNIQNITNELIAISIPSIHENDRILYRGFFIDGSFIHYCNSQEECLDSFIARHKKNINIFDIAYVVKSKKDFKEISNKFIIEILSKLGFTKDQLINDIIKKQETFEEKNRPKIECYATKIIDYFLKDNSEFIDEVSKDFPENEEFFVSLKMIFDSDRFQKTLNKLKEVSEEYRKECYILPGR